LLFMLLSEIDLKRKKHEKESFYKYIIRVRVSRDNSNH
jgi:hypothetical protein